MAEKVVGLRLFPDAEGKMNLALADVGGGLLVVSQFTLYGDAREGPAAELHRCGAAGDRDSAVRAVRRSCSASGPGPVETGEFGAMMDVELVNDGPVTLILER